MKKLILDLLHTLVLFLIGVVLGVGASFLIGAGVSL